MTGPIIRNVNDNGMACRISQNARRRCGRILCKCVGPRSCLVEGYRAITYGTVGIICHGRRKCLRGTRRGIACSTPHVKGKRARRHRAAVKGLLASKGDGNRFCRSRLLLICERRDGIAAHRTSVAGLRYIKALGILRAFGYGIPDVQGQRICRKRLTVCQTYASLSVIEGNVAICAVYRHRYGIRHARRKVLKEARVAIG